MSIENNIGNWYEKKSNIWPKAIAKRFNMIYDVYIQTNQGVQMNFNQIKKAVSQAVQKGISQLNELSPKSEAQVQVNKTRALLDSYRADFSKLAAQFDHFAKVNGLVYPTPEAYEAAAYEYLEWLEKLAKEDEKELLGGHK